MIRRIQVAATWLLVGCGGDPFVARALVDAGAGDVLELDQVDAGDVLEHDATHEDLDAGDASQRDTMVVDVAGDASPLDSAGEHDSRPSTDAGDVVDAPATCTPIGPLAYPFACTTSVAGDCPNGSQDCLWNKFLCAAGSCCRLDPLPNTCHQCRETFNCACLAAFTDAGCCDSDAGPYLGFRCP